MTDLKKLARQLMDAARHEHTGLSMSVAFAQTFDVLNDPAGARDAIQSMCEVMEEVARELERADG